MKYIALVPVTHSVTGKQIDPGDEVDLGHLAAAQIEKLKARGFVQEVPDGARPSAVPHKAAAKEGE
jgi:hypothetical protein